MGGGGGGGRVVVSKEMRETSDKLFFSAYNTKKRI